MVDQSFLDYLHNERGFIKILNYNPVSLCALFSSNDFILGACDFVLNSDFNSNLIFHYTFTQNSLHVFLDLNLTYLNFLYLNYKSYGLNCSLILSRDYSLIMSTPFEKYFHTDSDFPSKDLFCAEIVKNLIL